MAKVGRLGRLGLSEYGKRLISIISYIRRRNDKISGSDSSRHSQSFATRLPSAQGLV